MPDLMAGASWKVTFRPPRGYELVIVRSGSSREMVSRIPEDLAMILQGEGAADVLCRLRTQLELDRFHFQQELEEHDTLESVSPKQKDQLVHRGQRIAYAHIVTHLDKLSEIANGKGGPKC